MTARLSPYIGQARGRLLGSLLALLGISPTGCADNDACKGHIETCLSLTLSGFEGVSEADQLEVMVKRMPKPQTPMVPLGEPRPLPVKIAVLWPDGPGTVSVRSYLQGQLNGVSAELALDLRNGAHSQRKLTLYPPLTGSLPKDLGTSTSTDMAAPLDMTKRSDMTAPMDMLELPDLATSPDMDSPTD